MQISETVEYQIIERQKTISYDTREFTVEIIVQKYTTDENNDENELYVPDYQREFVWSTERQSKFIESLILGLPIPLIFVSEDKDSGRLEIVDGSQRIRTLAAFLNGELIIKSLDILSCMNDLCMTDLPISRQRKIKNLPIRMIVLSSDTSEKVKTEIFERINRGSDLLKDMEKRKGIYKGKFNDFIYNECAKNKIFEKLTPIGDFFINRQEHEELILRFFALSEKYPNYERKTGIAKFLDIYFNEKNIEYDKHQSYYESNTHKLRNQFVNMIKFVDSHTNFGFAKSEDRNQVSRVFFEAIAVGVNLALIEKEQINISKENFIRIISSFEFRNLISGRYHTHTPERIKERIDYIKNKLLND